jgi:hypothetical protein
LRVSKLHCHGLLLSVLSAVLLRKNFTLETAKVPAFTTSQALEEMVPLTVCPSLGALNESVGAPCAAKGADAVSASAAMAIGCFLNSMRTSLFLGMDYAGCPRAEAMPSFRLQA